MAVLRLSRRARTDLARLLAASLEHWGSDARDRYAALIAAGMRQVAADPHGRVTRDRSDLAAGLRGFHLRHTRVDDKTWLVRRPVHVVFYRVAEPGVVEIVRVLHERMEPSRRLDADC